MLAVHISDNVLHPPWLLGGFAVAAYFVARAGDGAGTALLSGLAAGFVPLMVFEMAWFIRSRGAHGLGTEPRG